MRRGAYATPQTCGFLSYGVCFRQALPLPCRADYPRVKHPIVNKDEPRMDTNRHEYQWTSFAATPSRDEGSGSAGVPPAQHWHSLAPLLDPARPATAPRFRFSRAQAVPAGRVAVCRITGKLSGHRTQRMRARRPRSRRGASSHPSCSARRYCPCRCGRAVPLRVPSVKHPIVNKDEPRMDTNRHEYQWTSFAATPSREEAPPGSAGVPPAQHWHGFTPLLHPARPATAPGFRFSRAQAVPAGRVAVCRITGKLSGHPTQRMRARRPRSRRGASSHPSCSARRHSPCRCGSAVPLRVPSSSFGRVEGRRACLRSRESLLPAAFATRRCLNLVLVHRFISMATYIRRPCRVAQGGREGGFW